MNRFPRSAGEALYASTKHGTPPAHPERLVPYLRLDPDNAPAPFKHYLGLEVTALPRYLVSSGLPAVRVLSGDRADESSGLDLSLLTTLLFLGAGVTRAAGTGSRRIYFRAAMSAGNLHPVEVYVVAGPSVEGLPAGVYHFAPLEFGLRRLRSGDWRSILGITTPAALLLTGIVWRTTWKYGERGWRHLYWDAGTMLANLTAAGAGYGVGTSAICAFADQAAARLVGVDGIDEMPLAVLTLGAEGEPAAGTPDLDPLTFAVAPVARRPVRLPLLVDAQVESSLTGSQVGAWRKAASAVGIAAPRRVDPPEDDQQSPIERVILQRGSTRVMRRTPVGPEALQWPLAASTRTVPLDATPLGSLLGHWLSIHAVNGISPGAYRWEDGDPHLIEPTTRAREISAALCLGQPLGGDSAYTVFHLAPLGAVEEALGSRGHRACQLEAGIRSGLLALAAFSLGLGATGLTFYDDPVRDWFKTSSAPMLVTAVGVPRHGPAPAGRPGEPALLR